jgi:2,3-bisphosphoglycerate-independent phosphoglycerate mutase
MHRPKPVMLLILDGWGIFPPGPGNAIHLARTPHLDRLLAAYPHTRLQTSGKAVGLPEGIMGNSEVGHLNIGAGRVVYQDLTRIDMAIENGAFFENQALLDAVRRAAENDGALHLIGLVSDGGVHSQLTHLLALLDLAKAQRSKKVYVHCILDGRDTAPDGGEGYVAQVQTHIQQIGAGAIASICGRYYAMDRDTRWDRTEKAYRLLTLG